MPDDIPDYVDITPRAVACKRGKTYDAEISFDGKPHRVISTGHKSHKEAMVAAQRTVDQILQDMRGAALSTLALYPKAKP